MVFASPRTWAPACAGATAKAQGRRLKRGGDGYSRSASIPASNAASSSMSTGFTR